MLWHVFSLDRGILVLQFFLVSAGEGCRASGFTILAKSENILFNVLIVLPAANVSEQCVLFIVYFKDVSELFLLEDRV